MTGRPPALTPAQQEEVRRRLAAGENARALAAEFKVGASTIRRLSVHVAQIRNVAETLAAAHLALEKLPVQHQHSAVALSEKLRSISSNLAAAADYGAKTAHRLQALANSEAAKVDDATPLGDLATLQGVGVLTELANKSAHVALNLLAANKDRVPSDPVEVPQIDTSKLSDQALAELLEARK